MTALTNFGKELKTIRKDKGFTIDDVLKASNHGISKSTLLRYEAGKINPKLEILESLSSIYSIDLCELFFSCQKDYQTTLKDIHNALQKNLSPDVADSLHQSLSELIKSEQHSPFLSYYSRLLLFVQGTIAKNNGDYTAAESCLLEALQLRFHHFCLDNYENYHYFAIDFKILDNYIDTVRHIGILSVEKSIEIYKYLYTICPSSFFVYPQICIQLAYAYNKKQLWNEAVSVIENGILASQKYNFIHMFPLLYYAKGYTEHCLHQPGAYLSFYNSYLLSLSLNNKEHATWLKRILLKNLNFDVENISLK